MNKSDTERHSILVIDDSRSIQKILRTELEQDFEVACASSGEEGLATCEAMTPDLILLDVTMPGMDGYATCQKLRENYALKYTSIIFLSSNEDVDNKLKGYDAGADHYVTKPYDSSELHTLIRKSIQQQKSWQQEMSSTSSIAHTAISNSGELGTVVQFYEQSFQCHDLQSLAQSLLEACEAYGLDCCTQIRGSREVVNLTAGNRPCKAIEEELMNELIGKKRILAFGHRTAFNFERVSLIVKNMPLEDSDKVGRLNDHVASLLNGAEVRTRVIDMEADKERQIVAKVRDTLDDIDNALKKVELLFGARDAKTAEIIDQLLKQMHGGFANLGLTEEQEEFFVSLVNSSMDKITHLYAASGEVNNYFGRISERLSSITRPGSGSGKAHSEQHTAYSQAQ